MPQEQKFEALMGELEKIVTELDSSIGLEESLKKFEAGMTLAKQAEARLNVIENEFQKIQQQFAKTDNSTPASQEPVDNLNLDFLDKKNQE